MLGRRTRVSVLVGFCFLCTQVTAATDAAAGSAPARVVSIHGEAIESSGSLQLSLELGPAAAPGLAVVSEPSHTLLAVVAESGSLDAIVAALDAGISRTEAALVTSDPIAEAAPRVVVPQRPESDDRVAVWRYREEGLELVADARVPREFAFSVSLEPQTSE